MAKKITQTFIPDWTITPGEVLEEHLEVRKIKQRAFAKLCGLSPKHINQIIHAKAVITATTALKFEEVLGVDASIWMNLDARYRLKLERKKKK